MSSALPEKIREALEGLPSEILSRSGSVFYSGKEAFLAPSQVYFLGLNPGGDAVVQEANTVGKNITEFHQRSSPWSAYKDELWEGAKPGTWGMQPRVLHMLKRLNLDPRTTPASNVVFVRSRGEKDIEQEKAELLKGCWPVHEAVIGSLGVRVIICFGNTAGWWVRQRIGADRHLEQYKECNGRRWCSDTHTASDGRIVVTLTHPSRANWCNPASDPTGLVEKALERVRS